MHPVPLVDADPRDPYHHTATMLAHVLARIPHHPRPSSSYQLGNNSARHRADALLARVKARSIPPDEARETLAILLGYVETIQARQPRPRKARPGPVGETLPGLASYTGDLFATD